MTDTSMVPERIGDLCHQFKLPTVGARVFRLSERSGQ